MYQHTIKKEVSVRGIGLHSGDPVSVTICPAESNSGIRFIRTDMEAEPVPAFMNKVVDTRLATTIGVKGATISTTEHLLAALYGLGIDNATIKVDGPEVPIMDGSAGPFVYLLKKAGVKKQKRRRLMIKVTKEINSFDNGKSIKITPYDGLKVTCVIDFDHEMIRTQTYSVKVTAKEFASEVASARTFGFLEEVEMLRQNGLALGGSLDNAVVMDRHGVLNEEGLRFSDELVRHKVVDLLGDLALLGFPILGHVQAYKPGHAQHLKLMRELAANPDCWEYVQYEKSDQKVIDKAVTKTIDAGHKILPFLVPPARVCNGRACSV